jgi:hypothetical protein
VDRIVPVALLRDEDQLPRGLPGLHEAVSLGGRVLRAPSDAPTEYWRAVIADPTGAVIGLVQLEHVEQPKEQP